MVSWTKAAVWLLVTALPAGIVNAEETLERAEQLYQNHCTSCHESAIHIRDNNRAKTFADIQYQVTRWSGILELSWNQQDIDEVSTFLNKRFYSYSE